MGAAATALPAAIAAVVGGMMAVGMAAAGARSLLHGPPFPSLPPFFKKFFLLFFSYVYM